MPDNTLRNDAGFVQQDRDDEDDLLGSKDDLRPLGMLAASKVWISWRYEADKHGKPAKIPYGAHGDDRQTLAKPVTWGTRTEAMAGAEALETGGVPNPTVGGTSGGLALVLVPIPGAEGLALGGLDLDSCLPGNPEHVRKALALLRSYCEISPSKTGLKVFFLYRLSDLPALQAILAKVKNSTKPDEMAFTAKPAGAVGGHPTAMELYLGRRWFAVTGVLWPDAPSALRVVPLEDLRRLIEIDMPAFRGVSPAKADKPAKGDQSGSGKAFALACSMRRDGCRDINEFWEAARAHSVVGVWKDIEDQRQIDRVWAKAVEAVPDNYATLPKFYFSQGDLPAAAKALAPLLSGRERLFDRNGPCRVDYDTTDGRAKSAPLTKEGVVYETHQACRPHLRFTTVKGEPEDHGVTLPNRIAALYLDTPAVWGLRPLKGFTRSPVLHPYGAILTDEGYDEETRLWCEGSPEVNVPGAPTIAQGRAALMVLRRHLRTFCFADAETVKEGCMSVVDLSKPPGRDESAALVGLLTAVARASLPTAPCLVVRAPTASGAGTGKGLLVAVLCLIASGLTPPAMPPGDDPDEFDKRLSTALLDGRSVIFCDNLNGRALKSDTLAVSLTEERSQIRRLGESEDRAVWNSAFVAITGNGLSISEDMVRRSIICELDDGTESPESRVFDVDARASTLEARSALLSAVLTVWRWGLSSPIKGAPTGSFELWGRWCRDPILALGGQDVAAGNAQEKDDDPVRQRIVAIFDAWWDAHGSTPVLVADLDERIVTSIGLPSGRAATAAAIGMEVRKLCKSRAGGYVLTTTKTGNLGRPLRHALYTLRGGVDPAAGL